MQTGSITKSQLISLLAEQQPHLSQGDVELAVNCMLDQITGSLMQGERIEIRGFGAFSLNYRKGHVGRNPKNGEAVQVPAKYAVHFKPGKELCQVVNF